MATENKSSQEKKTNRFRVGLSFPGEYRDKTIKPMADYLASQLSKPRVLYDRYHEAEFARPDLDVYLPNLYLNECDLVAVFLCTEYENKDWCGLEWRAVRALIKGKQDDQIMLFRMDDIDLKKVPGLLGLEGAIDVGGRTGKELARLILDRLEINDENLAIQGDQTLGSVTEEYNPPSLHDLKSIISSIYSQDDTGERRMSRVTPSTQKFISVKLPERLDSEFEGVIKQKICNELEADEAQFLKIGLLQYLPSGGDDATTTPELVNKLCQLNADDAIDGVLYNATMECLRGSLKRKANKHRAEIKNIAEQVLGWLVLFSVDGEKLNQLMPDEEYIPGIYFMLPVTTETGVEIIVSRKFQRQSSLRISSKGSNVEGNCLVHFDPKWVGWEEDDAVTEIIRMFWNKVFPADKKETGEIINEGKLNEMIQVRREDKWATEHYYLITEDRLIPENGHLKRVFQDLLGRLPQLTVACIAGDSSGGLLFVSEDALQVKIINFITRINEALGKTA